MLQVTFTFSYVREYQLVQTEKLLEKLSQWCRKENRKLEIEINDWAMADMLKSDFPELIPCYGRLLNKRKKDPRMAYKKGNVKLLQENNLNAKFYLEYLEQEFGIRCFEWESCGYAQKFPEPAAGVWNIICICRFTRRIPRNTARCMRGVCSGTGAGSSL